MTEHEYWAKIESIAREVWREAAEHGSDVRDALHETLDGHSYVIYTAKAQAVCGISPNADALFEDFGAQEINGFAELFPRAAYCAMERDVCEHSAWDEPFTPDDCEISVSVSVSVEPELSTADNFDGEDRAVIEARVASGDTWAWCDVVVTVKIGKAEGSAVLGGCSYASEADFRADPCFTDLVSEALDDLRSNLEG